MKHAKTKAHSKILVNTSTVYSVFSVHRVFVRNLLSTLQAPSVRAFLHYLLNLPL
jgi:hypothetical protein